MSKKPRKPKTAPSSVCRVNKNANYTVMSNYHLRSTNLSLKAIGLLSKVLSLPENWDYSIAGLTSICKEKETAIKAALDELKEWGYLTVTKLMPNQTASGRIEYVYDFYEYSEKDKPDADQGDDTEDEDGDVSTVSVKKNHKQAENPSVSQAPSPTGSLPSDNRRQGGYKHRQGLPALVRAEWSRQSCYRVPCRHSCCP